MIFNFNELSTGTQITIIICITIIIFFILVCSAFLLWQKLKVKDEFTKELPPDDNSSINKNEETRTPTEDEKTQKKEDRAKALVKDFYEVTRTKVGENEFKCDINVTRQLLNLYQCILGVSKDKRVAINGEFDKNK